MLTNEILLYCAPNLINVSINWGQISSALNFILFLKKNVIILDNF